MNKKTKQLFQTLIMEFPKNEAKLYNFLEQEEKKEILKSKKNKGD